MAKPKKSDVGGDVKVSKDDMMDVVGTGKVAFMPKGKAFKVHRLAGEKLIAKGKATQGAAEEGGSEA